MRKAIAALAVASLALGLVAATAGAQTVSRFTVLAVQKSGHRTETGFVIRGKLTVPGDRSDVVGHFKAKFHRRHVGAVFDFSDGTIKAAGNQNNHKVPIVGGSGRWNGASGKVKLQSAPHDAELLTFTVVTG